MNENLTGFPLCWPAGRPRTSAISRRHARFKTTFGAARDTLLQEIRRLNGSRPVISSQLEIRNDGLPYANIKPKDGDPGIAVYFMRNGRQFCFACDAYLTVDDNLHAICLTIEALRGIARWGTGDMMEAAFSGFAALPEKAGIRWWETLGVPINASEEQVREAYRILVKKHHPDAGGDAELFRRVREAFEEFNRTTKAAA